MNLENLKKEFQNHKLNIIQEDWNTNLCCYYCAKPETGIFSFYVITGPDGFLTVYGDIGRHSFRRHNTCMVGWIRGSIGSKNYVLEKLISNHEETQILDRNRITDFYKEEIKEAEKEMHGWFSDAGGEPCFIYNLEEQDRVRRILEKNGNFIGHYEDSLHRMYDLRDAKEDWELNLYSEEIDSGYVYDLLSKTGDEESMSSFYKWKDDVEWSYEALKCFVYLYDQMKGDD